MSEFYHITEMIKDDKETLLNLIQEILKKKDYYVALVNQFEECKGVKIEFYDLDGDDYGYPVVKWRVGFSQSEKDYIKFRGYYTETMYNFINKEINEVEFVGDYYELSDYINSDKFSEYTQEQLDDKYTSEGYEFDKYKEWTKDIDGIEIVYSPDLKEN